MKFDEEVHLWGVVDPDYVAGPGEASCPFGRCNLFEDHDGPHIEAHPCSGRIFGIWTNDGPAILPEEVSAEAVKIAMELNRLRDEAVEAIGEVMAYKSDVRAKYAGTTDSHVEGLLASGIWPTSEHQIPYCGTEASHEDNIREELLDILGLNGEED